jgi:nitrous oxidase accessory protein NosD
MKSLQTAVDRANPGDTLNVSGTCVERITVGTDRVTIDGGGTATIDGVDVAGTRSLVIVQALNVRIQNITVQRSPRHGIQVGRGGSAIIEGTTVTLSAQHGILVHQSAYARIGPDSGDHPAAGDAPGNDINNNTRYGISVGSSANADIFHNSITGNDRGINIINAGSANIDANVITDNTERGISLLTSGAGSFSTNSNHHDTGAGDARPVDDIENNLIQENGIGLRCRLGGSGEGKNEQNFGTGNPGSDDHTDDTDIVGCHVESAIFTP